MYDPRRHREIFVAMALAGSQVARRGHRDWLHLLNMAVPRLVGTRGVRDHSRTPYMGNRGQNQRNLAISEGSRAHPEGLSGLTGSDHSTSLKEILLPVAFEYLTARGSQLRTILLKARQNDEIPLIHQRAAKTRDIARARLLLIRRAATLLLGDGAGRNRYGQQRERKEKFSHCVPSVLTGGFGWSVA
jgi:hypothetical protein